MYVYIFVYVYVCIYIYQKGRYIHLYVSVCVKYLALIWRVPQNVPLFDLTCTTNSELNYSLMHLGISPISNLIRRSKEYFSSEIVIQSIECFSSETVIQSKEHFSSESNINVKRKGGH